MLIKAVELGGDTDTVAAIAGGLAGIYYGIGGERKTKWFVDNVSIYHRTFSEIVNSLCDAGFTIERMMEPIPTAETIAMDKSWEKDLHKPNFLLVKAKKQ